MNMTPSARETSSVQVLVVDDDDDVRNALCEELARDYAVCGACNGQEAFRILSSRRFDVVISDLKMPDHDGIEVLDYAREQDADVIRVLLTGYVDERAHLALLRADAPFKVGKPWHDEIEIVLRRALEQRDRTQRLSASLADVHRLRAVEAAVAATTSLADLGDVLALHVAGITGVRAVTLTLDERVVVGAPLPAAADGWRQEAAIDGDRRLVMAAIGDGREAHDLVASVVDLCRRRAGTLTEGPRVREVAAPPSRITSLMHHAAVGAMTGALLHDLASVMQVLNVAMEQVAMIAEERGDAELRSATAEALSASGDSIALFLAMRRFMRDGKPMMNRVAAEHLVKRATRYSGGVVRARAALRVGAVPAAVAVTTSEPLLGQVLIQLLHNAAAASTEGGAVDLEVRADEHTVSFVVTDDGPGVADDAAAVMFSPTGWHRPASVGTGLAIAASLMTALGGSLTYHRAAGRGACFVASVPRATTAS